MEHEEYNGTFKKQIRSLLGLQSLAQSPESTECAEKVEAMLSTAVLHLADLWNMLTLEFSEGVAFDPDSALLTPVSEIPPVVLSAMKSKLENSLEWCQLARSRLRDISKMPSADSKQVSYPSTTMTMTTTAHQERLGNLWQSRSIGSDLKLASNFAAPMPRSQSVGVLNYL